MTQAALNIYQSVILDHNRSPRGYGEMSLATHRSDGFNPICGDKVTVMAIIEKGLFKNLGFVAQSCALCRASASVMVEALAGMEQKVAQDLIAQFDNMIHGRAEAVAGDAAAFAAIKDYPARAKCVLLPWHTLTAALRVSYNEKLSESPLEASPDRSHHSNQSNHSTDATSTEVGE